MRWLLWVFCVAFVGCGDEASDHVTDVEGPRGPTAGPGPWPVDVLTSAGQGRLFVAVDSEAFVAVPVFEVSGRWVRGELPAAPVGARVRYYAAIGGERAPAGAPDRAYGFTVVDPESAPPPVDSGVPCELALRRPAAGSRITPDDDGAPQAGVQLNFVVEGVLPDQTAGVLIVGERRYAARALGGLLVFGAVDVASGAQAVELEATTPAGRSCRLEATIRGP